MLRDCNSRIANIVFRTFFTEQGTDVGRAEASNRVHVAGLPNLEWVQRKRCCILVKPVAPILSLGTQSDVFNGCAEHHKMQVLLP